MPVETASDIATRRIHLAYLLEVKDVAEAAPDVAVVADEGGPLRALVLTTPDGRERDVVVLDEGAVRILLAGLAAGVAVVETPPLVLPGGPLLPRNGGSG